METSVLERAIVREVGEEEKGRKAVILLSGGLDSTVTAYQASTLWDELYALTFNYGQKHNREVQCALQVGLILGVERHKVLELPLGMIGGSSLVGEGSISVGGLKREIPSTWVPQRNAIFLAIAFGWAEVIGAAKVYIGVNSIDYSGYPDCRPEFISAMEKSLNLASKQFVEQGTSIRIVAPLMSLSKKEIVGLGVKLRVPFAETWSCYQGGKRACGKCDSCLLRLAAFKANGIIDPIMYEED